MIASAETADQLQLKLLKVFSEMCAYCGTLEKQAEKVEAVFNVLLVSWKGSCLFKFIDSNFCFVCRNICHFLQWTLTYLTRTLHSNSLTPNAYCMHYTHWENRVQNF